MAPVLALTGIFTRPEPVIADETEVAPFLTDEDPQPMSNDAIDSADSAKSITQRRVRILWTLTEQPDVDYSAFLPARYTLWLINASSQCSKSFRETIAETLCSELYPTLALNFFFVNAVKNGLADESRLKWCRNLLGSLINFSDCSREFRQSLLENGAIEELVLFLSESTSVKTNAVENKNYEDILGFIFAILLNLAEMSSAKQAFNRSGAFEIFQNFLDYEGSPYIKAAVRLCLASIAADSEEKAAWLDEKNIPASLKTFYDEASSHPQRIYAGSIPCQELANALKILATSDSLKEKLMQNGVMDVVVDLLSEKRSELERYRGVDLLWTLCFGKNAQANAKVIVANKKCVQGLKRIIDDQKAASDLRELTRRAHAFIHDWERKYLASKDDQQEKFGSNENASEAGHILLSYSSKYEHLVMRMTDVLEGNDFKVRMDGDINGKGEFDEMAQAVEKASIVIIALSESYKRSANCRTEAEYAWALNKKILPIRVEKNYVPDGWLGALLQNKPVMEATEEIESLWMDKSGSELLVQVNKLISNETSETNPNSTPSESTAESTAPGRCSIQ